MRAIHATPLRIAGFGSLVLAAGVLGGAAGALIVTQTDSSEDASAPQPAAATATPDAAESLRLSIGRALESVVTVQVEGADGVSSGFGTGIVLSGEGLILTAAHVVAGASSVTVVLPGGEERAATVVADDSPFQDVALLQTSGQGLRVARLGSSSAVAIGDPVAVLASGIYTYDNQVKQGIISTRDLVFPREGVTLTGMLQTDAAVNQGDSGSPLINASGEVVGLMVAIVRDNVVGDAMEGVAFAHAIDDLKPFIDGVVATGVNPRGRIGIERLGQQHLSLTPDLAAELSVPVTAGAAIIDVAPGSPAESAGIQVGDVVVAVDGIAIDEGFPFVNLIGAAPTGIDLTLTVLRGDEQRDVLLRPRPVAAAGGGTG